MTDITLRFLTPLICGYLVFVILANKFVPWRMPVDMLSRPRWLLGCCCGATVAFTLLMFMQVSLESSVTQTLAAAMPLGIVFVTLIAGSVLTWLGYRKRCHDAYYPFADSTVETAVETAVESKQDVMPDTLPGTPQSVAGFTVDEQSYDDAFEQAFSNSQTSAPSAPSTPQPAYEPPAAVDRPIGRHEQEFLAQARKIANQQYEMRCKAEQHLRVTRKALLKLESEQYSRHNCESR